MKKRISVIGVLLILIITLLCMTVSADETETIETRAVSGQWTYTISSGNATITAYSGTATSITIPNTLDGYRVTGIGASVFADRTTLSSISFTSNLESIGSEAFRNCTSLSTITLPVNLTSIGYHAFYNCTNLSSITIYSKNLSDFSYDSCFYNAGKYTANGITVTFGDEVTRIPRYLFKCDQNYYARIKSVKMGSAITYIADSAFVNCFDLSSVTWGSGLVTIGSDAFNNCTSLSSVTLPESLEALGYHAFYNCTGLSSVTINAKELNDLGYDSCFYNAGKNSANGIAVTFGNAVTRIPRYLFKCDQNYYARIKSVKMGSAVALVAGGAFENCLDLSGVTWGSNLVTVSDAAFKNCTSLPNVSLPAALETISSEAFMNCSRLTTVTLPVSLTTMGYHAFYNDTALTSITINSKKLNDFSYDSCFYNAGKYAANGIIVTFGNEVTRIPRYLFKCDQNYYARIKSVKMGSAITYIADSAFVNCFDLSSVTWGSGLVTIGSDAFNNCTSLSSVTLPESLEALGYHAFYNCTGLSSVTINAKELNDLGYDSCFYNAGKNSANGIAVTFGNAVTRIPRYLFKCDQNYYARIKSVKMGSAVTLVADGAFENCLDLSSVTWGSNLVTVSDAAFKNCTSLPDVSLPAALETISSEAFMNCSRLTTVTLPVSLTTMGYHAFYNCTGLSSVTINAKKLNDLSYDSCFYNAGKNVANGIAVTFGNTVTRIPRYLFKCDQNYYARIKSVKMGSAVTLVAGGAFENCLDLSSVTWSSNLVTVSDAAFKNCQSISTISLPASVAEVGYQAFCSCKNLIRLDVNNPKCTLYGNKDTLGVPGTAVIYGYRNSTAQTYATKYGYSFVPLDTAPQPLPFTDVPSGAYYYDAVRWAVENNVTSGTSATTFSPNADCTRAQVVTFLWRAAGAPNPKSSYNPFSDVKSSAYYYKAVLWAVENKITAGTSATTFSPDASCTRAQVVTFLWRYEGEPAPSSSINPFKDVKSGSYYYTAVLWAVGKKVTSGTSSNTFSPEETCTRAQVVTFLYRDIA